MKFLSVTLCFLIISPMLFAEETPRVPVVSENPKDWWMICTMPDLKELNGPIPKKQHIVDHGFIQDANGKWQLWACMRGTEVSRLIYGWEGESLEKGPWQDKGIKVRADSNFGESIKDGKETAGAPHFMKINYTYYCFYHSSGFRMMTSKDGINYTRTKTADGHYKTGIPGGRDVMIMKHGDTYYSYATVTDFIKGKEKIRKNLTSWIVASTSKDLQNWSCNHIVSIGGKPGSGPVDSESPFVVFIDGYFYLFRASSITFKTYVYRSKNPLDFGIDSDEKMVAEFNIKAPELILHNGKWYISDLYKFQGIRVTELKWK